MPGRPNPWFAAPELIQPLLDFSHAAAANSLEQRLKDLVQIRVSQMNGCGICLQVHSENALRSGEKPERINLLEAWRETALYSARERAALGWAEALTRIDPAKSSEEAYRALAAEFDTKSQIALTLVIAAINAMNRVGVGFEVGPVAKKELGALLEHMPA